MKKFILYCFVGIINTCIGFGIIFALIFAGLMPEIANFLGYCVGIICSFYLNNFLTFSNKKINPKRGLLRFVFSMGVAYIANLIVLFLSYRVLDFNVYFSQIIAGIAYTLCGFMMSGNFVWKNEK